MKIIENTSKKYPNGSTWESNKDGVATIIGKSDRETKRKGRKSEKSHYVVQFEDGSQSEVMVKELKSGHFRKPKKVEKIRDLLKENNLYVKDNGMDVFDEYDRKVGKIVTDVIHNEVKFDANNNIQLSDSDIEEFAKELSPMLKEISEGFGNCENVEIGKRKYTPRTYINKNTTRLSILAGDFHFKYEDKDAVDILYQVCEDYEPFIDEYIDGGDGINNNALSKFNSTETEEYTLLEEMLAFEEHMYKLKSILPNTKFSIVEDNHYHLRLKNFLAENPELKGLIRKVDFPFDIQMPHGVPYFPFEQDRIGVIHGLRVNDNFTKAHSQLFKEDIINFHTHGTQHYTCKNGSKMLNKQPQKMWGMPSMCKQMDYMNGSPSRSNTGFGMLWYDLENDTYQLNYVYVENGVAVVNGKLYKSRGE